MFKIETIFPLFIIFFNFNYERLREIRLLFPFLEKIRFYTVLQYMTFLREREKRFAILKILELSRFSYEKQDIDHRYSYDFLGTMLSVSKVETSLFKCFEIRFLAQEKLESFFFVLYLKLLLLSVCVVLFVFVVKFYQEIRLRPSLRKPDRLFLYRNHQKRSPMRANIQVTTTR